MRVMIQRVSSAQVQVEDETIGRIGQGLLVFLGVGRGDTKEMADKFVDKLLKLRIFADEEGKTNKSVADIHGEILVVSQFTLYADCRKGNRPSFLQAGSPQEAEELYEYFKDRVREQYGKVFCGSFGADMKVSLLNDGPFTIFWDSDIMFG